MNDCLSENDVSEFVAGHASQQRRTAIEAHLDSCPTCLAIVAGTASQQEQAAAAAPAPPTQEVRVGRAARIVAVVLVVVAVVGASVLFLSQDSSASQEFPHSLAVFRDPSRDMQAAAVASLPESAFQPTRPEHPNFGFTRDALWLRLVLQNPESSARDVVLDATREWVDEVDVFEVVRGAAVPLAHSGARVPLNQRPIATERIAFPLTLQASETRTLLVRLHGRSPLSFRGEVSTRATFAQREASDQLLFGGYYAILLGLAAYSLLLFATLRDRAQLLLGILLASYALAEASSHGHVSRLFPIGAGWFEISGGAAAFSVFIAAFIALMRVTLDLRASPRLSRVGRVGSWVVAGLAAVPVAFPSLHFLAFAALLIGCIGTLAAIVLSARRDMTTFFFFLATGSLLIPGGVTLTVLFGALPAFPVVEYANHVGAVVMSCLFSLLIADAIRQQREKIGALNRELADGYEELRFQVAARSRELQAALARSDGHIGIDEVRPGAVFESRYQVVRRLGDGAWGRVYEVTRMSDGRTLALKLVTRARSGAEAARVAREAEIGARLSHPNLVGVVDVGIATAGSPFLVMELVRGGSLEDQRSRFGDVKWALPLLGGIARGLEALHRASIVHRDLKPANVLLGGGTAKLADFGIARIDSIASPMDHAGALADTASAPVAVTRTGAIVGTPAYMAPEAVRGARGVGVAADVFALGVMACEMLTGLSAFAEAPFVAAFVGRAPQRATRIVAAEVPEALSALLEACLALDPDARPSSADLVAAFDRLVP